MALPPCTLPSESTFVDVGRGVALVEIEARVIGAPCVLDAGSVVRAREEGRAPPELIAFRIELDGRPFGLGGPRGRVVAEIMRAGTVRFVAAVRGDRFVAAPLSTDRALIRERTRYRLRTRSVWGAGRIAGVSQFVETGAPLVVASDPTRDHEPVALSGTADGIAPLSVLVIDGGPMLGGDPTLATEPERTAALARGGVDALSVLLSDLPLAVATAPDSSSALARLMEITRAARASAISPDPILAAIGQRTASAIGNGFKTCVRASLALPRAWPAAPPELVATGLLDEAESGCPRVDDLLAVNHPDIRFAQEGSAAIADVTAAPIATLPRIGALLATPAPARSARKSGRFALWMSVLSALAAVGLFVHRASR